MPLDMLQLPCKFSPFEQSCNCQNIRGAASGCRCVRSERKHSAAGIEAAVLDVRHQRPPPSPVQHLSYVVNSAAECMSSRHHRAACPCITHAIRLNDFGSAVSLRHRICLSDILPIDVLRAHTFAMQLHPCSPSSTAASFLLSLNSAEQLPALLANCAAAAALPRIAPPAPKYHVPSALVAASSGAVGKPHCAQGWQR